MLHLRAEGSHRRQRCCFSQRDQRWRRPSVRVTDSQVQVQTEGPSAASPLFAPPSGHLLDSFARASLWDTGLDYLHGTGHGVGCFLNVHEGPCGISYKTFADEPLEAGMIVSDGEQQRVIIIILIIILTLIILLTIWSIVKNSSNQ